MSVNVSVVIPVYNSAKFLQRCIDSLLAQTETGCEFIFVNDGSTDNSREIIEGYQHRDGRVKLVNQHNQGVSAARNNGMRKATGNYIAFVDADDYADNDLIKTLHTAAIHNKADIVIANYIAETNGVSRKINLPFAPNIVMGTDVIGREVLPAFIGTEILNHCWNKLYKKELLHSGDLVFPVGMAIGEDGIFNLKAFSKASSVVFLNYAGYHYLEVDSSATRNAAKHDYFKRAVDIYNFDYAAYINAIDGEEVRKLKAVKFIFHVLAVIGIYLGQKQSTSFIKRMAFVRKVINDKTVAEAIALSGETAERKMTRYQKFLLNCIRRKNFPLLLMGVMYSTLRKK